MKLMKSISNVNLNWGKVNEIYFLILVSNYLMLKAYRFITQVVYIYSLSN